MTTSYQYGSGFFWEVQGLLVCPACKGDPRKMDKHGCPPEGEWHGIYFTTSEDAAVRRLARLIDDVSSYTEQYEDYRIAQPATGKPKERPNTPWKNCASMFTEIPNIVFDRHIGEPVVVGWTTCSSCNKEVRYCECPTGPSMSEWLKRQIALWTESPAGLGSGYATTEDDGDEPVRPKKPKGQKKAKKGKR